MFEKIKEKWNKFNEFQQNGIIDMMQDYTAEDKDNIIRCSKCGSHLGLWRMIFHAMQVERGEIYKVVCKRCKFVNVIRRSKLNGK